MSLSVMRTAFVAVPPTSSPAMSRLRHLLQLKTWTRS